MGIPAYADLASDCSGLGGFYFSEIGNTAGVPQDAAGCITIGSGTITAMVNDTVPSINQLANVLDGFDFTTTGGAITGISLTSVSVPLTFVDCFTGPTCVTTGTFVSQQSNMTVGSPYGWGAATTTGFSYGSAGATGNFSNSDPGIFAGSGSLHPAGIVNASLLGTTPNGSLDGNGPHNDLLLGGSSAADAVTFNFSFTGTAPTGVSGMDFYFGTAGDKQSSGTNNSVPEPSSLILLVGGCLVVLSRKRQWASR
jgi:hypothetical protein